MQERAFCHAPSDSQGWLVIGQCITSAVRGDGGIYRSLNDLERWLTSRPPAQRRIVSSHVLASVPDGLWDEKTMVTSGFWTNTGDSSVRCRAARVDFP